MADFLSIHRGDAPLIITFPHGGTDLMGLDGDFISPWLARKDADWWIADIYGFARKLGATLIATRVSRAVIDCNRDPSGASLYPGQETTALCPATSFDGEPLYRAAPPDAAEIARRRDAWFTPYHQMIREEIARLRRQHPRVVLYDAHAIRSQVPRLFEGALPRFNIGTNGGASCAAALSMMVGRSCAASGHSWVLNGRFKGGWTTRHHGRPAQNIHAIQMELAMRAYLAEPEVPDARNWPAPPAPARTNRTRQTLTSALKACLAFCRM